MAPALSRGFLLPFDDICNIGDVVILSIYMGVLKEKGGWQMYMCDICGKSLEKRQINRMTEEQVFRATSDGFVPSNLPMQGYAEQYGLSLSKEDHWVGTVLKYRGTGIEWGVCLQCLLELLNFVHSKR